MHCRWLLALWGLKAIPLLPLLNLLSLAAGLVVTVGGKWIFIGRYREGEHPIWGWYYIRHWFAHQFLLVSLCCACCGCGCFCVCKAHQHNCMDSAPSVCANSLQ